MTALQKIIKTAKGLQKKNKSLAWKDAIKKAGVIYRKEKKTVKSVKAKKTIGKKPAVKKAVKKKAISKPGQHTDTKSHNVNIRVVSGMGLYNEQKKQLIYLYNELQKSKGQLSILRIKVSKKEKLEPFHKLLLKRYPKYISHLKRQISSLEKQMK